MVSQRRGGALTAVLAGAAVLLIVLLVLGFGMGWIDLADDQSSTTIRVDKVEMKEDTDEAAESAERTLENALKETGEGLKEAGERINPENDDRAVTVDEPEIEVEREVQDPEI